MSNKDMANKERWAAICLATLISAWLPTGAASGEEKRLSSYSSLRGAVMMHLPDDADRQRSIRISYEQMAEVAGAAGHEIEVELSNFRTVFFHEFADTPYVDTLTFPGGRALRAPIGRHHRTVDGIPQPTKIVIEPEWVDTRPWPADPETLETVRELSLYDVVAGNAARGDPEQRRQASAVAATIFDVHLAYGGESRSYRALAFWLPPAKERHDADFGLVDHIAPLNLLSLVDGKKVLRHPDAPISPSPSPEAPGEPISDFSDQRDGRLPFGPDPKAIVFCQETERSMGRTKDTADRTDHSGPTGAHNAGFGANYNCSCDGSCRQDCTPSFTWKACDEWGPVGQNRAIDCHVISQPGYDQYSEDRPNGHLNPSSRLAGVACSWQWCPDCTCFVGPPSVTCGCGSTAITTESPRPKSSKSRVTGVLRPSVTTTRPAMSGTATETSSSGRAECASLIRTRPVGRLM